MQTVHACCSAWTEDFVGHRRFCHCAKQLKDLNIRIADVGPVADSRPVGVSQEPCYFISHLVFGQLRAHRLRQDRVMAETKEVCLGRI
jgi:hypothetical protein